MELNCQRLNYFPRIAMARLKYRPQDREVWTSPPSDQITLLVVLGIESQDEDCRCRCCCSRRYRFRRPG